MPAAVALPCVRARPAVALTGCRLAPAPASAHVCWSDQMLRCGGHIGDPLTVDVDTFTVALAGLLTGDEIAGVGPCSVSFISALPCQAAGLLGVYPWR